MALNSYLQFSGVDCLIKEEGFNLDKAQVFALTILISLASISLLGTLVHVFNLKSFLENDSEQQQQRKCALVSETGSAAKQANGAQIRLNLNDGTGKDELLFTNNNEDDNHDDDGERRLNSKLLRLCQILVHFSIVKNGRKLFDTSTSRQRVPFPNLSSTIGTDNGSDSSSSSSSSAAAAAPTTNSNQTQSSDISCVHGLRFWTISWIIFGHTMQYTEWAAFGRAYQVEQNIVSFWLHPLMNATFSVDTFFLISGLLTTYVTWSITRGNYNRFNKFAFLISRYLRLTPQVLLVILLFIIFPLMGDGPYWKGLIQKESENCKKNWWVNALYLQAFIKQDNICNLVTWWLSIEMFYHLVSIIVIIALLKSKLKGYLAAILIGGSMTMVSVYLHFTNAYPPNMLPTLLQRYEIWDSIVLKYFWTPYPHAAAYFTGLILGYLLYNRKSINQFSRRQVRLGWLTFLVCYLAILFGTYKWNNNSPYDKLTSTLYYNLSQLFWSFSTAWLILACALGHGGWLNDFLSSPLFIPLGRATYMTYLSHMIIVMSYPAKMNLLIEPSYVVFLYIFISNLVLSYGLGIVLTLVYESPILRLQKILVTNMAQKFVPDDQKQPTSKSLRAAKKQQQLFNNHPADKSVAINLYSQELQLNQRQDRAQQQLPLSHPC